MRVESSVTSVSWIPSEAVTGAVLKGTFDAGITSYDDPPPDAIDDLEAWRAAGRFRFANHLAAWAQIQKDPSFQQVADYEQRADDRAQTGGFGVAGATWFDTVTTSRSRGM